MRHSKIEILIQGDAREVIRRAFDLPAWPSFLPHYRWVKVLEQEGDRRTVEMACYRSGIPLKWRSHLWTLPEEGRMRFRHVAGPARGMEVEWTVVQEGEQVRVTIHHDLSLQVPLVRTPIGQWIVSEVFIRPVAGRTLAELKRTIEADGGSP
jgi:ribosome-associated toxin RatA of RatAB toxin-antitoxin module